MRLVRYADDFVVMIHGTRDDAQALYGEVATVLAPMGLRLSEEKTRVCHINEGFDFLGWRIQRRQKRGHEGKWAVYTYPSKKALLSVIEKVRSLTRRKKHKTLALLLRSLNAVLRGWCNYFRHGVCSATFGYLDHFAWWRSRRVGRRDPPAEMLAGRSGPTPTLSFLVQQRACATSSIRS
jgi:RNA-directed DNA polymerase